MKDQPASKPASLLSNHDSFYPCVEKGIWVSIPKPPPQGSELRLNLKDVDSISSERVKSTKRLTFHAVGCSGRYEQFPNGPQPGVLVAQAMEKQAVSPGVYGGCASAEPSAFLFHLGDIVYKEEAANGSTASSDSEVKDQGTLYNTQFYGQYNSYKPAIFAVAGNHDSKISKHLERSGIDHFLSNFCDSERHVSQDNRGASDRRTMIQPYPYWVLNTSVAYIIGLHTNDLNGGLLDDPEQAEEPQYAWLVETLAKIKANGEAKRLVLALHYPPYSGAANFHHRGDPNLGPTPRKNPATGLLQPLAVTLEHAFQQVGLYPDLVISAHAHLYQRITYTYIGGFQIPYLIVGSGGHWPVENIAEACDKSSGEKPTPPFPVVLPRGVELPHGDSARVVAFNDTKYGYSRITIDLTANAMVGEFFTVDVKPDPNPKLFDSFHLDFGTHKIS
jgi:acid phosphatase type 7